MAKRDEQKKAVATVALKYLPHGDYIGIGTGSTVNYFIAALKDFKKQIKGAVTTSRQSEALLKEVGIKVVPLNEVYNFPVYFDGADEVNPLLQMLKGGGGALLAEKIVASAAENFVCLVDDSKYVNHLGKFPVAVEVLPYARALATRRLADLGGSVTLRSGYVTASGNQILDTRQLDLSQPLALEQEINSIPGVVDNGIFARNSANVLLIGKKEQVEVKTMGYIFNR